MKHKRCLVWFVLIMFASIMASEAVSAETAEAVRTLKIDRTSAQGSFSLLQIKLNRAVHASTSRASYPSLNESQYRDFLALHYDRVVKQAERVREQLLAEGDRDVREKYLPKAESIIYLHEVNASDRKTKSITTDFWQDIILDMDRKFQGGEAAERELGKD